VYNYLCGLSVSRLRVSIFVGCLLLWTAGSFFCLLSGNGNQARAAAADTSKSITVDIISATNSYGLQTDSGLMQRMVGNVQLKQGDTYMSCDSAWLNLASNNMEAFSNVKIIQPGGTQVTCDYLRYRGNVKLAYLKGNVGLTDGKSNLWSEDLSYDVGSKIGTYENGGTLQNDATTLSSTSGIYNTRTKDSRFKGEVMVNDPQYEVTSDDLGYNTATKVVRFFGPSVVVNDKSRLTTSLGTYDSKAEIAHLTSRSTLQNGGQYIEADLLDYDRNTGWGKAKGRVIAIDTEQHSKMWSGYAAYNEISLNLFSTIDPVLLNANGSDSLYIAADTFFSAPQVASLNRMSIPQDTVTRPLDSTQRAAMKAASKVRKPAVKKLEQNPVNASEIHLALEARTRPPQGDSTAPRYYIGYKHVRIWSDSLQGVCDSISYSARDSVMKMMQKPVAWSRESQISGDTILLFNDSSRVKRLYVPNNALVISRTGPVKADIFDQVQGRTLNAYFKEKNKIDYLLVFSSAESIYYPKDDSGAYLGVDQSESERMRVFFKDDGGIRKILLEQEPKHTMSPLDQVSLPAMRLSRFQWFQERRPKSRDELFPAEMKKPVPKPAPAPGSTPDPASAPKPDAKSKKVKVKK
jgi:lipopolysaccharide export system protein LptA